MSRAALLAARRLNAREDMWRRAAVAFAANAKSRRGHPSEAHFWAHADRCEFVAQRSGVASRRCWKLAVAS